MGQISPFSVHPPLNEPHSILLVFIHNYCIGILEKFSWNLLLHKVSVSVESYWHPSLMDIWKHSFFFHQNNLIGIEAVCLWVALSNSSVTLPKSGIRAFFVQSDWELNTLNEQNLKCGVYPKPMRSCCRERAESRRWIWKAWTKSSWCTLVMNWAGEKVPVCPWHAVGAAWVLAPLAKQTGSGFI